MEEISSENVLTGLHKKLGRDQGNIYYELKNKVLFLDIKWKEFKTLYCNSSNVEILNKSAAFFFSMNQQIMLENIILDINKIASERGSHYKYLSIRVLPDYVKERYKEALQIVIDDAVLKAEFAKERRNKQIAHYSLNLALKNCVPSIGSIRISEIEQVIEAYKKIIQFIQDKILNEPTFLDVIYPLDNANALINRLKKSCV